MQTELVGADSDVLLYDPTSVALNWDEKIAYVVTGGSTVDGKTYGGQVVEVEI